MNIRRIALAAFCLSLLSGPSGHAANLTWDANPAAANAQDGSGVWNSSNTNWWNGTANAPWNSLAPDNATFGNGGTAGIVTNTEPVSVGGITFNNTGTNTYTITGGTNAITLINTPTVTVNATNATIASILAGSGFSKAGSGRLILTYTNNAVTGSVSVAGGVVQVGAAIGTQYLNGLGVNNATRSVYIGSGARLQLIGRDILGSVVPVSVAGGVITNDGFSRLGPLTLSGGTIACGNGNSAGYQNYTLESSVTVTGTSPSLIQRSTTPYPSIHLEPTSRVAFVVNDVTGSASPDLQVTANLMDRSNAAGAGGLRKLGSGTLSLENNTASGLATLEAGTILLTNGTWSGPMALSNGATLLAVGGNGLMGQYYRGAVPNPHTALNSFTNLNAYYAGLNPTQLFGSAAAGANFDFGTLGQLFPSGYNTNASNFQVRWTGKLQVTTPGAYYVDTASDDGSMLYIDGQLVVNNNFYQGVTVRSGVVYLGAGLHDITIIFYQGGGGYGMYADLVALGGNTGTRLSNSSLSAAGGIGSLSGDAGSSIIVSNGALTVAQAAVGTFAGQISGNGGLCKIGSAPLILAGTNLYAGETTVAGGSLVLAGSGGLSNCVSIQLQGGAVLDVAAIPGYTIRNGQTLGGAGTVSGALALASGAALTPGGIGVAGTLNVAGDLALAAGSASHFDLTADMGIAGSNDWINVASNLTLGGDAVVYLQGGGALGAGPYRLIDYTGTLAGAYSSVAAANVRAALAVEYGTPGAVTLFVTNLPAASLRWNGTTGNEWRNGIQSNWYNFATLGPDAFYPGDAVSIEDLPGLQTNILIAEPVSPASLVISNSSRRIVIAGARITGTTGLTKLGTNTLDLGANNQFTGPVVISGGTVRALSTSVLGSNSSVTVANGAQFNFNGYGQAGGSGYYTVAGVGPDGRGALVNTNASIATASGIRYLTLTGDTTISSEGTNAAETARIDIAYTGGIEGNGYTITKIGGNVVDFRGSATNTQLIVNEGFVYGENVNDPFGTNLVINAGAFAGAYGNLNLPVPVTLNGGTLSARSGANLGGCTWSGPVSVPVNSTIASGPGVYGYGAEPITIAGPISGAGSITIIGASTVSYRGTNTYMALTTVRNSGGTLNLATPNSPSINGPVQLGHLVDGGGAAVLQMGAENQLGPGSSVSMAGSPGDFTYLKLMGTTQFMEQLNTDENGGPVLENVEGETNILSHGRLVLTGGGNSTWAGTYMRDRSSGSSPGQLSIVLAGPGTLSLAGGTLTTYSGGTIVSNGTLNLKSRYAAGWGDITLAGGGLALDGFGLMEGSISAAAIAITNANPQNGAAKLTQPRANRTTDFGANTTWAYTGYLVITGSSAVTYSFAENIDDGAYLRIDDAVVLNNGSWNTPTIGTITLSPGLHLFDLRCFNGGGNAGPNAAAWWTNAAFGFGYDALGRGQTNQAFFQPLVDSGDGRLLCTEVVVTNIVNLAADTSIRVSNLVGPTNSISGLIFDGGLGYGFTKIGEGALAIAGPAIYNGATLVSNGTLLVNGLISGTGTMTVSSNATLCGTGMISVASVTVAGGGYIGPRQNGPVGTLTLNNLTFADNARFAPLLNGGTPSINDAGTTTTGTNVPVEISSTGTLAIGTYALFKYTGTIGGGGSAAFSLVTPLPNGAQGYLNDNIGASMIELVITNSGTGLRWTAAVDDTWAVATPTNWALLADGSPRGFSALSDVLFDDTVVGSRTVRLLQTISAGSITVSNSSGDYVLVSANNPAGLTGPGGLTKRGTGRLTLAVTNSTFSGNTTVEAGSVVVSAFRPFGNATSVSVSNGGQVNLNGIVQGGVMYSWFASGAGPDGMGAILNTNAALYQNSSVSNLTLTGNVTIGAYGPGTTDVGRLDLCVGGTLNGGGYQITKTGAAPLNLRGTTVGLTNIAVLDGILVGENSNNSLGSNIVVTATARLAGYGGVANGADVQIYGGRLTAWGGAACSWNGTISLLADSIIDNNPGVNAYVASDININGRITGPAGFTKLSPQTLTLSGASDFAGPLTVKGGTVRLTGGNDRLPTNVALTIHGSDTTLQWVDMGVINQAIGSLSGTNTYGAVVGIGGTLTFTGAGSGSYFGLITGAGSVVRSGTGVTTLNNSNRYAGGTTINSGRISIRHHMSLGLGAVTMNGGTLGLDASGLWEGRLAGNFNTASANPKWAANLTTEKANSTVNTVYPDNTTYAYTGWLNITGNTPVTWSFVKRFDDNMLLSIDGSPVISNTQWDATIVSTITLAPGLHTFDLRCGEGTGGIGPTLGWPIGFGYDTQGRNAAVISNFVQMVDPGDGSLFVRDDLTFTNAITLNADAVIDAPAAGVPVTIAGTIGGAAGFAKTGPGYLSVAGTGTYAGATFVSNGALFVQGALNGAAPVTVISGAQLWGRGSIAGSVTIQAGATVGARNGVTNAGITLTMPSLSLDAGAVVGAYLNGTNPTIRILNAGALNVGISNLVQIIPSGPVATGTYPLIAYNTSLGGSGFSGLVLGPLPNGASGYLNNNTGAGLVELVITNAGAGLKWYGSAGSGIWDVATTPHWAGLPSGDAAVFQQFDSVIFGDDATNFAVSLAQPVSPAAIVFSNEVQNYTLSGYGISGGGGLTKFGSARLHLNNASSFAGQTIVSGGTLSLLADSSLGLVPVALDAAHLQLAGGTRLEFMGTTTVPLNRGIQLGTGTIEVTVQTGVTASISSVIGSSAGVTSALVKTGSGMLTLNNTNGYRGGTFVNEGVLNILYHNGSIGGTAPGALLQVNTGAVLQLSVGDAIGYAPNHPSLLDINGGTVTVLGGANFRCTLINVAMTGGTITSPTNNNGDAGGNYLLNGTLTVNASPATSVISAVSGFSMAQTSGVFNVANGSADVDLLVTTRLMNWTDGAPHGLSKNGDGLMLLTSASNAYTLHTLINGGTLQVGDGISGSIGTNAVVDNGVLALNVPSQTFAQVVSGTGSVVKLGAGYVRLSATNTYAGGTIVSAGYLDIAGTAGSGRLAVQPGATLRLTGTVDGAITNDGMLVATAGAGLLTLNSDFSQSTTGSLNVEIGGAAVPGSDYDMVVIGGTAMLDGALNVSLINGYVPTTNDQFQIIVAGALGGTFASTNLPALTGGLTWAVTYGINTIVLSVTNAPASYGYDLAAQVIANPADRGYQSDPDGDGFANLLEYATGGSLTNVDQTALMKGARTNGLLVLRFSRNTNAVDATIIVEGSFSAANGAAWQGLATNIAGSWGGSTNITELGSGSPVNVTAYDTVTGSNRFLRLRVARP